MRRWPKPLAAPVPSCEAEFSLSAWEWLSVPYDAQGVAPTQTSVLA